MLIDTEAIEAAAAEADFTGIVSIDAADDRVYERCFGFAHRALGVPNTSSEGAWPIAGLFIAADG